MSTFEPCSHNMSNPPCRRRFLSGRFDLHYPTSEKCPRNRAGLLRQRFGTQRRPSTGEGARARERSPFALHGGMHFWERCSRIQQEFVPGAASVHVTCDAPCANLPLGATSAAGTLPIKIFSLRPHPTPRSFELSNYFSR
jgi:hypothetical protein